MIIAAAALAVAVGAAVVLAHGGGTAAPGLPGDDLAPLEVSVEDIADRWNDAITELSLGDELADLVWTADAGLGLEHAERSFVGWGLVDFYRDPGGDMKAVDLVGTYVTDDDRNRFQADAIAALVAAGGLDLSVATRVMQDDLRIGDAEPSSTVDVEGLHVVLERSATTAELRITAG